MLCPVSNNVYEAIGQPVRVPVDGMVDIEGRRCEMRGFQRLHISVFFGRLVHHPRIPKLRHVLIMCAGFLLDDRGDLTKEDDDEFEKSKFACNRIELGGLVPMVCLVARSEALVVYEGTE